MNKHGNLLKSFTQFSLGPFAVFALGLLTTPIITRLINPTEYGKLSMFNLISNIFALIAMCGVDNSFVRFFYEEKNEAISNFLMRCILLPSILSLGVVLIVFLFYDKISMYLFEEINIKAIIALNLNIIFLVLNRFSLLIIRMKKEAFKYSVIQILQKFLYIIMFFAFYYYFGEHYYVLIYAVTLSLIIVTNISVVLEKEEWFFKNKHIKAKNDFKLILVYGVPLVFNSMITWIFQSMDKISLKQWSNYEEIGIYAGAMSIVALLNVLQSSFSTFWVPVAFEHYEKDKEDKKFYIKINNIVTFCMIGCAIGCIMFKDIIILILGEKYKMASSIMPFLVFIPIMYTISETTVLGINFMKKPKYHIIISVISCLVNLVGNSILVPKFGARGAAISTGISYIVFFLVRSYISNKLYYIEFKFFKVVILISLLFVYSLYAVWSENVFVNIFIGSILLIVLFLFYYRLIYDTVKNLLYKNYC